MEGEGKTHKNLSFPLCPPLLSSKVSEEEKEIKLSSRMVSLLLGDHHTSPGQVFERWVAMVRKRSGSFRPSGFPHRRGSLFSSEEHGNGTERCVSFESVAGGADAAGCDPSLQEMSLWERLGKASSLDIYSSEFSWDGLSSLHHTEHSSSTEQSDDEANRVLEVTVNSGGVVFFGLFASLGSSEGLSKEAAVVIKFASSRMTTQSERLGYEFARWLGVQTPQARVIHNCSVEWQQIKDAAEKARATAASNGDDMVEMTCFELIEALELSRCLLLMNYIHGSPLLESSKAFSSHKAAGITAAALGRILMLDLILRNEDRLPCRQLGWRGNSRNLLVIEKPDYSDVEVSDAVCSFPLMRALNKERRAMSVNLSLCSRKPDLLVSQKSDASETSLLAGDDDEVQFRAVAIDSGVPRRPPAGKRAKDQELYPKFVELILNDQVHTSHVLHEVSGGKLGFPADVDDAVSSSPLSDEGVAAVHEFRAGFRAALRDMQGIHVFLLALYQKLDGLLRMFLPIIGRSSGESDSGECGPSDLSGGCSTPANKGQAGKEDQDSDALKNTPKSVSSSASRERYSKWSGYEPSRNMRLTMKLRDFQKNCKVDSETSREIEQWNELLRSDVIKFCQDNDFNTGFFDGSDANAVVDAYELKVRLEHILERIMLISDAANTERPSIVTDSLFIGGALAARSKHTLLNLGITHVLCLCSNEIGQSDSQYPDLFKYCNFSISDDDDACISDLFEEAANFIVSVEMSGGKVLVHCFEGKSRSATVVLAYLMLRKGCTLSEAWSMLKKVHRRAQPNDGFAKSLLDLDKSLHGKTSMNWQQRRPAMKVCPICGKNAGLSTGSLKLHLQKSHKRLSSGSADSATTAEIRKALDLLKISRGGSVSPNQKLSQSGSRPS